MPTSPVYTGLIKYLHAQKIYSNEIDGVIDENGDGKIDAPDNKNSKKEWEHFFKQAERYSEALRQVTYVKTPKNVDLMQKMAKFYYSVIEYEKNEKNIFLVVWAFQRIIVDPSVDTKIKDDIVAKLFSIYGATTSEEVKANIIRHILWTSSIGPKMEAKMKEKIIIRFLSIIKTEKSKEALKLIGTGFDYLIFDKGMDDKITEKMA